jgi:hypothetical protein
MNSGAIIEVGIYIIATPMVLFLVYAAKTLRDVAVAKKEINQK